MKDIQPPAPVSDRARIAIVCATIAATALVYTTQTASFLHLKLFVLACGLALLGIVAVFVRPGPTTSTGWAIPLCGMVYGFNGLLRQIGGGRMDMNIARSDGAFLVLTAFILPMYAGLAYGPLARETNRHRVAVAIVATATCTAILGIGQYAGALSILFPRYPGASPIYSVFGNPGLLGGYVAIALPLALAMYLRAERVQPYLLAAMPVLAGALLLSSARTAWLACAAGCAVSVWKYANARRTAIAAIALAGVAVLCVVLAPNATLTKAAGTFTAFDAGGSLRLWFWAGTWDMIKAHPIAGVGIGRYALESPLHLANVLWAPGGERFMHDTLLTEHPHNDFLLVWAEAGVLGIALMLVAAVYLSRTNGPEWGGLSGWFVFALFNSPLHSPPHALAGFLLAACLLKRSAREKPDATAIGNWGGRFLGVIALPFPLLIGYALLVPSYRLQQAQTAHVEGGSALALYSEAAQSGSIMEAEIDEKYAVALLDVSDYESARDRFKRALRYSDAGSVYLGLGSAEYLLGNRAAAYSALEKAVYRWPSHLDAWRLLLRVCPDDTREGWLVKARRFLDADELAFLAGKVRPADAPRIP